MGVWIAEVGGEHLPGVCAPPTDTCAIFVCMFFSCMYSVYVATSPEAISTEYPLLPWHIFMR